MSIWCSGPTIGFDVWEDPPVPVIGQVRSYATGWSNHYPTIAGDVERPATVDLAHIPAWCAGGEDDDFDSLGGWVRLSVVGHEHDYKEPTKVLGPIDAAVVLDEAAVRELVRQLSSWLDRPKVQP